MQAKSLGDYLVVGVHSDAEIAKNKGPPVMNEEERFEHFNAPPPTDAELKIHRSHRQRLTSSVWCTCRNRYKAVEACKWVDEVVRDAPYVTQVDWLDKYNIDFCVHGDDVTTASDGTDCYALVKAAGRYKEVPRTTGVSTTDLVTRMLECTKDHHLKGELDTSSPLILSMSEERKARTGMSKWISSHKIRLFSDGKQPKVTLTLLLFQASPSHKSDLN